MANQPSLEQEQASQEQHQQPFSDQPPSHPAPSSAMKTYHMFYTACGTSLKLHLGSSSGPCVYYMEGVISFTKPQLHLRLGDSKSAPMVAFAKIPVTARHILLGLEDHHNDPEGSLVWEDLKRDKIALRRSDYEFGTSVGSDSRKVYSWKKDMTKLVSTIYSCVDNTGQEPQIVARMLSGGALNWKNGGEIKVAEGLEKELEEMLLISALAIWAAEGLMGWSILKGRDTEHDNASDSSAKATHSKEE